MVSKEFIDKNETIRQQNIAVKIPEINLGNRFTSSLQRESMKKIPETAAARKQNIHNPIEGKP